MGKLTADQLNNEGCVRLACRLGQVRSYEYRSAFRDYIRDPSKVSLGLVKRWENKLKGPITALDDSDIKKLQRQVYEGKHFDSPYSSK